MKALIAIDGSAESALAVETAASLTWPEGSQIEILTVLPTDAALQGWGWIDAGASHVDELRQRIAAERATHRDEVPWTENCREGRFGIDDRRARDLLRDIGKDGGQGAVGVPLPGGDEAAGNRMSRAER